MEGIVDLLHYFENQTAELLVLGTSIMTILFIILMFLWLYNKKKYNSLKHQIPAGVVKNYLDSIIQNSSSLKSSLFRGELGLDGVPSVMPISNLPGGDSIEIQTGGGGGAPTNNAELAALQAQLAEKLNIIRELEDRLANMPATGGAEADPQVIKELETKIIEKEKEIQVLKEAPAEGGGGVDESEHDKVKKERDDALEKLKEYEVIEDDLANLKRLKQENEQLKKSLEGGEEEETTVVEGGSEPAEETTVVEGGSEPAEETTLVSGGEEAVDTDLQAAAEPMTEDAPAVEAAAEEVVDDAPPGGDDVEEKKTPEDLLSEFEKMLG
jgi:hypothetical protein